MPLIQQLLGGFLVHEEFHWHWIMSFEVERIAALNRSNVVYKSLGEDLPGIRRVYLV